MGFTGCGAIIPTTGTVYIYVATGVWATDIYMDYAQKFNNIYTYLTAQYVDLSC